MTQNTQFAKKLEAVYHCLTANIQNLEKTFPEIIDHIGLPMLDLENLVNEANGFDKHGHRKQPAKILKFTSQKP